VTIEREALLWSAAALVVFIVIVGAVDFFRWRRRP